VRGTSADRPRILIPVIPTPTISGGLDTAWYALERNERTKDQTSKDQSTPTDLHDAPVNCYDKSPHYDFGL
jgi:hypothetical protein